MASRSFLVALVALMLVASAAAQVTPAHFSKTKLSKCARTFPNCARCGRVDGEYTCTRCGRNTEPFDGTECPCDAAAGAGTFSPTAWAAYVNGEDKCKSSKGRKHGSKRAKCPARPTGCVICDSYDNCALPAGSDGACAYIGGDETVTRGRRLFGADEEIWA
jgi:hypothetical protein